MFDPDIHDEITAGDEYLTCDFCYAREMDLRKFYGDDTDPTNPTAYVCEQCYKMWVQSFFTVEEGVPY